MRVIIEEVKIRGRLPALEKELLKRLNDHYDNCRLTIRRAGSDGLSVFGGDKDDKKKIESILQETWESADDWFY
ncbi:DinI-like family protein [Escherichia coli]|nr:DinI-like family protein [Escherichia coli]